MPESKSSSPQAPEDIPVSSTRRIYQQLRQLIIRGEIAPAERLKIDQLKKRFDSAASPIREALSLLTSDQLVERLDQRGFRAAPASEANFQEILALRCRLDDMALRQSIRLGNAAWEEKLVLAQHHLLRSSRDERDLWEARHRDFHLALLAACDSPILLKFCEQLYDLNIRYRYLAGLSLAYEARDINAEHLAILNAVLDRDADRASSALLTHYRQTGDYLVAQFNKRQAS